MWLCTVRQHYKNVKFNYMLATERLSQAPGTIIFIIRNLDFWGAGFSVPPDVFLVSPKGRRNWFMVGKGSDMLFKLILSDWIKEREQPFTYYISHSYLSCTFQQIALGRKHTPSIIRYLPQQFYFRLHFLAFQRHVCATHSFGKQHNPGSSCTFTSNAQ